MTEAMAGSLALREWEKISSKKICATDIDGVLNFYPRTWVQFVNERMHESFKTLQEVKSNLSYSGYRALKEEYRLQGEDHGEARAGAKELFMALKRLGYTVIVITARPADDYPNLYHDTTQWLDKLLVDSEGNLLYDHILFSGTKHTEVLTKFPRLRFMIEDHRTIANIVSTWGYKVFLMDNEYNQGALEKNVTRVMSLSEIQDQIMLMEETE